MNELRPGPGGNFPDKAKIPFDDRVAIVQHLVSHGLLDETLTVERLSVPSASVDNIAAISRTIQKALETPPKKSYALSKFGRHFLRYFDAEPNA